MVFELTEFLLTHGVLRDPGEIDPVQGPRVYPPEMGFSGSLLFRRTRTVLQNSNIIWHRTLHSIQDGPYSFSWYR